MGTVDHDRASDAFAGHGGFGLGDLFCFIVGFPTSATEHDMAVRVAHGSDDRGLAIGVDTNEMVRCAGGGHSIDRDMETAFSAVLKTNRHGHPAGHFSMGLAFGRAGSDGRPTDEVGNVLWADRIQQLCPAGKA